MSFALEEFFIDGIKTNKDLQEIIMQEPNFFEGKNFYQLFERYSQHRLMSKNSNLQTK